MRSEISMELVSLLVEGFKVDRTSSDGIERQFVRLFACNFACNNTPMVEGKEDAHALCDAFFERYYSLLDWSEERLQQQNQDIHARFSKYYEATAFIGKASDRNVPVKLSSISGSIPFAAFV